METPERAERVQLASYGILQKGACPFSVHHALLQAEEYWYGDCKTVQSLDVMLHAVIVLGLYLGLRFDEIQKIKMENISETSGKCTVSITETTKNR